MKVKFLAKTNFKRDHYDADEIADVEKDDADVLVAKGIAIKLNSRKPKSEADD